MRTLKELYELLFEFIEGRRYFYLCHRIEYLIYSGNITREEFHLLSGHFKTQKPNPELYVEFYNNPLFLEDSSLNGCWFRMGEGDIRRDFVKAIISTL